MPRELLTSVGADIDTVRLDGAYYFHGTRVRDPDVFRRRGLLPLDQLLDGIWKMLYEFVSAERTSEEWAAFRGSIESGAGGHDGSLYRLKASDALPYGPHALLVREILLDPHATGSHDYLGCPEIVQDIARCYQSADGGDLEARFCAASVACIVKFRHSKILPGAVRAACWYVWSQLRNQELTSHATWGFDGEGDAVPPDDVLGAEVVT